MTGWWQPALFAIGLGWCGWEVWRGATRGIAATQIREFRRDKQPGPFWTAMILNLMVVGVCAWFLWHWTMS